MQIYGAGIIRINILGMSCARFSVEYSINAEMSVTVARFCPGISSPDEAQQLLLLNKPIDSPKISQNTFN